MTKNYKDIITLPNKSLRQRSKRVGIIDDTVISMIQDMIDATLDWEDNRKHEVGVALAAVQINELLRVVVIRDDFDNKGKRTFTAFINPAITKYEGQIVHDYEGCLSVQEIYGKVPRHSKVRIKATGIDGQTIRLTADGFLARVFQHEIDHTNGIVFIDHIKDETDAFYKLDSDGQLLPLNFETDVKNNPNLWQK